MTNTVKDKECQSLSFSKSNLHRIVEIGVYWSCSRVVIVCVLCATVCGVRLQKVLSVFENFVVLRVHTLEISWARVGLFSSCQLFDSLTLIESC